MSSQSTPREEDDPRVGTSFGDYRIDALLGRGGMGTVYRATARDASEVALKLVKPDLARDETYRRRFRREARIAQTVRNPHVVPVLDTGELDGIPYLAAQFIDGASLDQKLKRERRLDVRTTIKICAQVAEGLQALWEAGMVHRDVKPGNILLDREGTAYIADFGLAKITDGTNLTEAGQSVGSIDYVAPEQIRGEQVTGAADTYSLGCVVFECVEGHPPFAHLQGIRVLWGHMQDEPPELSADRTDVPPGFAQALKSALRKDPAERPASSIEFARSLGQAAGVPTALAER